MREFRPTPPTGGREPENPWAHGPGQAAEPEEASHRTRTFPDRLTPAGPVPYAGSPTWVAPAAYHHPRGPAVLVLGVLSVVMLPVLGPFAWAMAHSALTEIDRSGVPAANRSMLVGGMITGIVGTVFLVLGTIAFIAFMGLFATSMTYGTG